MGTKSTKTIIYAPGNGWGHLNRAMAIGACAPTGTDIEVWLSSPYVGIAAASAVLTNSPAVISGVDVKQLEGAVGQDDTLVVDAFPCGVAGELKYVLAKIAARKILVLRNLPERYAVATCGTQKKLDYYIESNYDLVINCENMQGVHNDRTFRSGLRIDPIVMRATPPPRQVDGFYLPPALYGQVLVIAAGNEDELGWYGEVCAELGRNDIPYVCIAAKLPNGCDPKKNVRHWPAVDYLEMLPRCVIGGAGYNTVHETRHYGIPLVAKPWPRRWDDQAVRAAGYAAAIATTPADAVHAANYIERIASGTSAPANGASRAAELIWGCAPTGMEQQEEVCSI